MLMHSRSLTIRTRESTKEQDVLTLRTNPRHVLSPAQLTRLCDLRKEETQRIIFNAIAYFALSSNLSFDRIR